MGHLAFSIIGQHASSSRFRVMNRVDVECNRRFVVVHQRRTAQDYLISGDTLRHVRRQVSQDFLIVANTDDAKTPSLVDGQVREMCDDQGALIGSAYVVPEERRDIVRKKRNAFVAGMREAIESDVFGPAQVFSDITTRIADARADRIAILRVSFALFRTGELRIWFDEKDFVGRQVHPGAIPLSYSEKRLIEALPAQIYYFIKDAAHFHYHHEHDSDQLLPLTQRQSANDVERHELDWRRHTLWGLARVVSQFRRGNELYALKKAMGVLAYAESFQSTLAQIVRRRRVDEKAERHSEIAVYDFAHTRASVEALESLALWRRSGWVQLFATLAGVVLSCLALWAAAVQIRPIVCEPLQKTAAQCPLLDRPESVDVILWVVQHPLVFTGSVTVLAIAIFVIIVRDATFVPWGRSVRRLLSPLAKATGATVARKLGDRAGWVAAMALLSGLSVALGAVAYKAVSYMLDS